MPDLDGFELMARLKSHNPDLDVILMTGSVDDLTKSWSARDPQPRVLFIQKPFDRDVLRTLVERCVELRWRRDEHRRHLTRLETEMGEARAFQQGLLPAREAIVNRVGLCCRYTPSDSAAILRLRRRGFQVEPPCWSPTCRDTASRRRC